MACLFVAVALLFLLWLIRHAKEAELPAQRENQMENSWGKSWWCHLPEYLMGWHPFLTCTGVYKEILEVIQFQGI